MRGHMPRQEQRRCSSSCKVPPRIILEEQHLVGGLAAGRLGGLGLGIGFHGRDAAAAAASRSGGISRLLALL